MAETRQLQMGNLRIRLRVSGTGRPLLLLNGLGAPLELWTPLQRALTGTQTIAVDAPGCGGSQVPDFPLRMTDHADIVLGVLDALGYDVVDVLGFSFGGMVAQELARLAPARVRRLVLASTWFGLGSAPGSPAALLALATPDRYYSRTVFEAVAPFLIGGREARDARFLRTQGTVRKAHPPAARGYVYQLWAAACWSSLPWLATLRQPTLVLSGAADPLVPAVNALLLAALIPNARSRVVADGGHLVVLDQAATLAPEIGAFLTAAAAAADRRAE